MLVLATSTPLTETREKVVKTAKIGETTKTVEIAEAIKTTKAGKDGKENESNKNLRSNLIQVPYIWYPITLWKKFLPVSALFDSGSKFNAIYPIIVKLLGLPIRPTNIRAQKIDNNSLNTCEMVIAAFSVTNKANQLRFFEKTFIVANVCPEVVFGMLFFILNGADVNFLVWKLRWKIYTTKKALSTTKHVELVGKKEFAAITLDQEHKTYVVHVRSVSSFASSRFSLLNMHLFCRPQIASLIAKKVFTKISAKYSNFADIFSPDLVSKLPKHIEINDHAIELIDAQQPPYELIHGLRLVKLEILKAYIETNLANGFIKSSKSPVSAPILFNRKSDGSL